MTALTAANARIGALVRAVLILEYPLPVPTTAVAERVSYRYDPTVYRALARRATSKRSASRTTSPGTGG